MGVALVTKHVISYCDGKDCHMLPANPYNAPWLFSHFIKKIDPGRVLLVGLNLWYVA